MATFLIFLATPAWAEIIASSLVLGGQRLGGGRCRLHDHLAGIVDDVGIVPGTAVERVLAGIAAERIVADATDDDVIPRNAVGGDWQPLRKEAADNGDHIVARCARQRIGGPLVGVLIPQAHRKVADAPLICRGAVKIDMPNPYSVYMHDTNVRNLFTANYRFLSHGCTRVDNVRDLAAWILEDTPGWDRARIDAGIAAGQRIDIRLTRKIPVAWVYLTGWVTRNGTVQFRDDVYEHDGDPVLPAAKGSDFLTAAGAGGFVRPRETRKITQASNLDSR